MTDQPQLHIDSDWKAQAEAERQRLAEQESAKAASDGHGDGRGDALPPADMRSLVGMMATQALSGLGMYGDRESGRIVVDFEGAKFAIDLLGVLEEKTKGNLTDEEAAELKQVLAELRSRFVQLVQVVAQQQQAGGGATVSPVSGATTPSAAGGSKPSIIIPG
ncbi:MAG: DUF1844 domain-containing protein [Planctomycetota bacterium]|nr:DUF1844 domain-containing protein [Planctomycetota bacterium]MDA1105051.1 DUF1844 domain-containing protein [Planctomycetota bacterium]